MAPLYEGQATHKLWTALDVQVNRNFWLNILALHQMMRVLIDLTLNRFLPLRPVALQTLYFALTFSLSIYVLPCPTNLVKLNLAQI